MKQAVLVLAVLFPIALAAQEGSPSSARNQSATPVPAQARISVAGGEVASERTDSTAYAASDADANSPQQPQTQPSPPSAPVERPRIPGSMVGYIDNPIVESQIRVRFEAGFKDNAPDRAEFFYAQCGCNPNGPGPRPGASNNINFQQLYFLAEYAPVSRFSVFSEVPIRWIQPQSFLPGTSGIVHGSQTGLPNFSNQSGISDVRAGFKLAVTASSNHSLTLQFKAYFPSGDSTQGLGTNHYSVEPSLLYYQRLSDRWAVESQIGGWHPINGSTNSSGADYAGDIFFYGFGPSYQLVNRENIQFAPVVELFGWHVLGGLQTLPSSDASGINIVNLKVGARTSFGRHNSVYVGFGQALTHQVWYEHIVRAEYRYSF